MDKFLKDREDEYGQTWVLAAEVIHMLHIHYDGMVTKAPWAGHNWVLILSKLVRALFTPNNPDHWKDMAGYATLCYEYLTHRDAVFPEEDTPPETHPLAHSQSRRREQ